MSHDQLKKLRQNEDFINEMHSRPFNSYSEYKQREEDLKVMFLIRDRYLKLLGQFIESTYSGLRFDIFIRNRNPKEKKPQWYGHTYMELVIFDVITQPVYCPNTFAPTFRTATFGERISMDLIYDEIDSFIPEINKHLMITFIPHRTPEQMYVEKFNELDSFECWDRYWKYDKLEPRRMITQF